MLPTVGDDVGDGDDLNAVLVGEIFQRFHAGHCSVGVHDFTDDRSRILTGQPGQVNRGLGLARSFQNTAFRVFQRKDVAGLTQVLWAGFGVDMPVVAPFSTSTDTVKAVPRRAVLS